MKRTPVQIRIPDPLLKRLRQEADKRYTSLTAIIIEAAQKWLCNGQQK